MSFNPKVSVCIPSYNGQNYIGKAIESVLTQTYADFELIITDDCSTDQSRDVIEGYKDERIRFIHNERNLGAEANSNKAISEARGKYIKLLEHDDYLYPSCLEKQVDILETAENRNVVLTCCGRDIINKRSRKILQRKFKGKSGRYDGRQIIKRTVRAGTNIIGEPTAVLIRSDILRETGVFDDTFPYVTDLDLWCRMLLRGDVYMSSEVLCAYRVSPTALSVSMSSVQRKQFQELVSKLCRDKSYPLNKFDCLSGKTKSYFYGILRNSFYKIVLRKK